MKNGHGPGTGRGRFSVLGQDIDLLITSPQRRRLIAIVLPTLAAAALASVTSRVARETIDVVQAKDLLPRWDLATHIVQGWVDYHLLVTGRIPELLWDLWLQGYWPPVPSIYMIPFFVLLGGGIQAAAWSSLVALLLIGAIGAAVHWRLWGGASSLSVSVFLALLMSSPFVHGRGET